MDWDKKPKSNFGAGYVMVYGLIFTLYAIPMFVYLKIDLAFDIIMMIVVIAALICVYKMDWINGIVKRN